MLSDILYPMERDKIPGLSSVNDSSGHKRIDKLNDIFRKSQPLKPWPLRENKDSKVSIERIITRLQKSESDLWFVIFMRWRNLYLDNVRLCVFWFATFLSLKNFMESGLCKKLRRCCKKIVAKKKRTKFDWSL